MKGFEKIELKPNKPIPTSPKQDQTDMPARRKRSKKSQKFNPKVIFIVVVCLLLLILGVVLPAKRTYVAGIKTYQQAKLLSTAVKTQNIEQAGVELAKTKQDLAETQKNLHMMVYLKVIPLANFYYNDADHAMNAGAEGLQTAGIVIDSLQPYADVLGLKGKGSFSAGSAEDRIKTAVLTMGKITPRIDTISDSLQKVKKEVDKINPKHYPKFLFGSRIQAQIASLRSLTDQSVEFVNEARPLIKVLPSLLGETEQQKYLVIFQNDKELRPTGGFITAYAIFSIDKGVIKVDKSEDIYTLDATIPKPPAPPPIQKYLPKVYTFNLRDSNLSPDFQESMKTFMNFYNESSDKTDVNGVIAIDTNVLVQTIKILDDNVEAQGITFTTKNDPRCDCPQAIYDLENNISRPVNYIKSDRKGLLGSLLFAIMKKAMSSSPKIYWGPLFQSMLTQANQKHVLFDMFNQDAQSGIASMNASGQIKPFDGDYLHINDANFGGAKSNLFVTQKVDNTYEKQGDGSIQKTLTLTYKNNHAPSDCNLEHGDLCLNADLRDWIRIYVPKGSQLVSAKGSEVKVTASEDLGKTVFEGFLVVRPLQQTIYTITYKLPFKVSSSTMPYLIQKQPGTYDNNYTITVNGRQVETFPLLTDQTLQIHL